MYVYMYTYILCWIVAGYRNTNYWHYFLAPSRILGKQLAQFIH